MRRRTALPALILSGVALPLALMAWTGGGARPAAEPSSREIDAQVWSVISTTVVENDIEGMARTYHPDAVVVIPRQTMPIGVALQGWGDGMVKLQQARSRASVAFRFSRRQDDAETAFEAGMFNYAVTDSSGAMASYFIPFEALLVKKDGRWLIVMERQLEAGTESAWNALPQ